MKPYDPQLQCLQLLLSSLFDDFLLSKSIYATRRAVKKSEKALGDWSGEKLCSTPLHEHRSRLFSKTLTHNDELLYVMELRSLLSIVQ
ncbi:hypothetical protein BOTCAL_0131g00100 [Botryotinia calthae]|uniref:Uncharacterized protein n=1 Tax=Botryotinia calthae TaxID=38488 RepID=A0A4Y8D489_9HELO|nr:hypothetical protein BOTCAL_0131g00100 [Botryotinia calthae]